MPKKSEPTLEELRKEVEKLKKEKERALKRAKTMAERNKLMSEINELKSVKKSNSKLKQFGRTYMTGLKKTGRTLWKGIIRASRNLDKSSPEFREMSKGMGGGSPMNLYLPRMSPSYDRTRKKSKKKTKYKKKGSRPTKRTEPMAWSLP